MTSPSVNEKNVDLARGLHLRITKNILENISQDAHIIYLSTDKVFDGSDPCPNEESEGNPSWVYGKLKLLCEDMIKEKMRKYHILRLPIVHSMGDKESIEQVYIGGKDIAKYLSACFYALGQKEEIIITARGNNIKRAVDVTAILIRQYLDNPSYDVVIGSEEFEDRNVSTIDITLRGKKKDAAEIKAK